MACIKAHYIWEYTHNANSKVDRHGAAVADDGPDDTCTGRDACVGRRTCVGIRVWVDLGACVSLVLSTCVGCRLCCGILALGEIGILEWGTLGVSIGTFGEASILGKQLSSYDHGSVISRTYSSDVTVVQNVVLFCTIVALQT
jgi:hypothetical protein